MITGILQVFVGALLAIFVAEAFLASGPVSSKRSPRMAAIALFGVMPALLITAMLEASL